MTSIVLLGAGSRQRPGTVAKRLKKEHCQDATARETFAREAALVSNFAHSGLVKMVAARMDGDQPCYLMEYVPGRTVGELKGLFGQLELIVPVDVAIRIVREACVAVHHACKLRGRKSGEQLCPHHGSLSGQKIMLTPRGTVVVTGFAGRANSEATETPAPGSETRPPGCDVSALGLLLHDLVAPERTRQPPVRNSRPLGRWSRRGPNCPEGLKAIITKAVHPHPSVGYRNVKMLQLALDEFANQHEMTASRRRVEQFVGRVWGGSLDSRLATPLPFRPDAKRPLSPKKRPQEGGLEKDLLFDIDIEQLQVEPLVPLKYRSPSSCC